MIISIGIDSVDIERFLHWHTYDKKLLSKIFHDQEIDYCLSISSKSAERFAVRFAAKEAFYKAFTQLGACKKPLPLFTLCKYVSIIHNDKKIPEIIVQWDILWQFLEIDPFIIKTHFSLTHSKIIATAVILLER